MLRHAAPSRTAFANYLAANPGALAALRAC